MFNYRVSSSHRCSHFLVINGLLMVSALWGPSAVAQGYAGMSIGQSRSDIQCADTVNCERNGTAYKLFGGYLFTPYLGLEASYYDQGKAEQTAAIGATKTQWLGRSYGLQGVLNVPYVAGAVFVKFGALQTRLEREDFTSSMSRTASTSTEYAWGLGLNYNYSNNAAARIELERLHPKFGASRMYVDLVTLGFLFRF